MFPILCEEDLCGLTEKFRDLKKKGVGRIAPWLIPASRYKKYTGSTLSIDYDTPEYWEALKPIPTAVEKTGLSIILHDEPGWPSGQAGGKILERGGSGWIRHVLLSVEVSNTLSNLFMGKDYVDKIDSIYSPAGARYVNTLIP